MAPLPDYYAVLGVSPSATPTEVREAYKRQSLQCHPDRFPNVSEAEKQKLTTKFQSLADACEYTRSRGGARSIPAQSNISLTLASHLYFHSFQTMS
jgi:hypothetical protein